MSIIKEKFIKDAIPAFQKEFGYSNIFQVPHIEKVVMNIGLGSGLHDPKFQESVEENVKKITGQKPLKTHAKKSISNFKIRSGQVIGMKVTLRGKRMYDFLDKLIHITIPRIRDFRGLPVNSVDSMGNLHIGFKEHIAFPEIKADDIEKIHGLEVSIINNSHSREKGLLLYKSLGFPFAKQ